MNIVNFTPSYYPELTRGRPISLGKIYVGVPDTDPTIEANQRTLSVRQEDGTIVEVSQPIRTNAAGVPVYDGSPVTLLVTGDYSLKILDSSDVQQYYIPYSLPQSSVYCPDPDATDQGVTGDYNTIKYYVDLIGATNKATIYLTKKPGSEFTDYVVSSDLTITDNIAVVYEKGARLAPTVGVTVTYASNSSMIYESYQDIKTGAGTVAVSSDDGFYYGIDAGSSDDGNNSSIGIGKNALSANTSGLRNIAMGTNALKANITGNNNYAIGYLNQSVSTSSSENVSIGTSNLVNNTTGPQNVAIGGSAVLQANTEGIRNIGINSNALNENIDGDNNIAIGYSSQRYDVTGDSSSNISIGTSSLSSTDRDSGNANTVVGHSGLASLTVGNSCTGIGSSVLSNLTTAIRTIGVGYSAGTKLNDNTTPMLEGNYNIFIGDNAMGSDTDGDASQIVIGRDAEGIGAQSVVLGSRAYTDFTQLHGSVLTEQAGPAVRNSTGTLTIAQLLTRLITSTAAGAINWTLPTGTDTDAGGLFSNNDSFDWTCILTGAGSVTVIANTAHTIVGNPVVSATSSGMFRTRKSATNTFITYRLN